MRADNHLEKVADRPLRLDVTTQQLTSPPARGEQVVRFTSNIVGSLLLVNDIICLLLAAPMAVAAYSIIRGLPLVMPVHILAFVLMFGSFLLIRSSKNAYQHSFLEPIEGPSEPIFDAVLSILLASALVWQVGLIEEYSRGVTVLYLLSVAALLSFFRPFLRRLLESLSIRGSIEQRIVLYGFSEESLLAITRIISSLGFQHLRFIGVADDRDRSESAAGMPAIGGLQRVCELARKGEVDQVLISGGRLSVERIRQITEELSSVSVDVSLIPEQAVALSPDYRVNLLGNMPVLTLWQRPLRDANRILKRAEDLVLGVFAIILLAPVLAISALLIRITSRGPILFIQPRTGFNNEIIRVYKFRTMYVDSTDLGAVQTTVRNDPRVTAVGRVLRRLSIDELPQLLNVLEGTMSLVGPRPHAIEMKIEDRYYHEAVSGYAGRHRVKPGITGLAQVKGLRGELRTIERAKRRVELDQFYIDNWSLWFDIRILLATVRAVLFDRDAF